MAIAVHKFPVKPVGATDLMIRGFRKVLSAGYQAQDKTYVIWCEVNPDKQALEKRVCIHAVQTGDTIPVAATFFATVQGADPKGVPYVAHFYFTV